MPSFPIYLRKWNYEKIRRYAQKTGKTIGQILNALIEEMEEAKGA